jgi:hypothetical protein
MRSTTAVTPDGPRAGLLPVPPAFADGWTHSQPDVVIEMPVEFEVPAEGQVDVTDFYVKAPFADDVFVINSFSKYFNMTGWRLGWMVAPQRYVRDLDKLAQNLYLAAPTPAQLTAMRNGPSSPARVTAAPTDAESVTSAGTNVHPSSRATDSPFSWSRSRRTTRAPSAARRRAVAAPSPDPPPLTIATQPAICTLEVN